MNTKDAIRLTLIDLMDSRNISGKDLAEAVGVSKQAVSSWRTGKSSIDIDNVPAICRFFGITFDQFFGNHNIAWENTAIDLTEDEVELVRFFRHLNIYQQAGIFWMLGRINTTPESIPDVRQFINSNGEPIKLHNVFESGYLPYPIDNVEAFKSGQRYGEMSN